MKYHNARNKMGQFTKPAKAKKKPHLVIKNGSLYNWRGVTVRAVCDLNNGLKLVSFHKSLFGFINAGELTKINIDKVKQYLRGWKLCGLNMRFQIKENVSCADCQCEIVKTDDRIYFYKTKDGAILCEECYNFLIEDSDN